MSKITKSLEAMAEKLGFPECRISDDHDGVCLILAPADEKTTRDDNTVMMPRSVDSLIDALAKLNLVSDPPQRFANFVPELVVRNVRAPDAEPLQEAPLAGPPATPPADLPVEPAEDN